ncbi:prolyl-tRNA editing enzyme YbaK/EbsC (Cys-tRNA(Pro) deacylase) [Maritalea mobilis]|uniref:Prolyl-tRNA editing enzyme YbaK/EbsC (Cys-tRNA(Pro) deacylase) n=1 Tax=Maritalea mobilis TaxID=483324 RepID=A0A4R6VRT7_9HYPH|nr:YbaK/EbsC family protein [Maritalea mobilis]TDQ66753.1 prolyl-tRNA editing enzyme YbaK/EbsC (Cys-tRNA(Pro) deacylase) [Maritalea mobilis]
MTELSKSEQRVDAVLRAHNLATEIVRLDDNAHTAQQAADALGIEVAQIVKSLVFRGAESDKAYLLLVSGANRVHEKRTGRLIGEKLGRADADFVREHTGFAIGGVSPLGATGQVDIYIDETLFQFDEVWAAAGHPKSVFPTSAAELTTLTAAQKINVL